MIPPSPNDDQRLYTLSHDYPIEGMYEVFIIIIISPTALLMTSPLIQQTPNVLLEEEA